MNIKTFDTSKHTLSHRNMMTHYTNAPANPISENNESLSIRRIIVMGKTSVMVIATAPQRGTSGIIYKNEVSGHERTRIDQ